MKYGMKINEIKHCDYSQVLSLKKVIDGSYFDSVDI